MTGSPRHSGFSLFELTVVLIIVAVLAAVLMDRLAFYQARAELLAAQAVAENIRLSLRIRSAQLMAAGDHKALTALAEENPIRQLQRPPGNYLGELDDDERNLPTGHWFYRKRDKHLVYLLNYGNLVAIEGQKSLNFKVKLLRWPNESATPKGPRRELAVVLEQVDG